MATDFKLPELGEGVESGTVTKVLVGKGDEVSQDQPILELETDKAVLEVPSPVSGTVTSIKAEEGSTINVGDVVFSYEEGGNGAAAAEKPAEEEAEAEETEAEAAEAAPAEEVAEPEEEAEPEATEAEAAPEDQEPSTEEEAAPARKEAPGDERVVQMRQRRGGGPAPATPSVRRLAREIGIDINDVPPGDSGRITQEDVKDYARRLNTDSIGLRGAPARVTDGERPPLPNFERWGEVERRTMESVRRRTAENMAYAWSTIPQVTQFDKADVTELEDFRKRFGRNVEAAGGKLTMTAILIKVVAGALRKYPQFNATLDLENDAIIHKHYYNVGVAVDTDRGLLVPVLRDADRKNITEIAVELGALAQRARDRKTKLDEMQGGSFTISNLGGIGGTSFTPIVNPPEVAILGVSRSSVEPVWRDGQFVPRTVLPLSLTYDHRVIDGADGARFLRWIVEALEQPFLLHLEG